MDKYGKKTECKTSYIPMRLCGFPDKDLAMVVVYGFGKEPMILLTNSGLTVKNKLWMIVAKVYLMRWRI